MVPTTHVAVVHSEYFLKKYRTLYPFNQESHEAKQGYVLKYYNMTSKFSTSGVLWGTQLMRMQNVDLYNAIQ